jgi:hypothetical protein
MVFGAATSVCPVSPFAAAFVQQSLQECIDVTEGRQWDEHHMKIQEESSDRDRFSQIKTESSNLVGYRHKYPPTRSQNLVKPVSDSAE